LFVAAWTCSGGLLDARSRRLSAAHPLSAADSCAGARFFAGETFPIGRPSSITVADFTHDGHLDFASVAGGSVQVFAGDGAGGFERRSTNNLGDGPIAAADFDGDGNPDLLLSGGQNLIVFATGDGAGGFSKGPTVPGVFGTPRFFAVGDFDGDGRLDFVVLAQNDLLQSAVTTYLGDGHGDFTRIGFGQVVGGPDALAFVAGDFNNDGRQDVAVSVGGGVSILFGDGAGQFPTNYHRSLTGTASLAVGDFNGDQRTDLAIGSDSIVVLLSDGSGGFTSTATPLPAKAQSIVAADYDGDGRLDLAVAGDGDAAILKGDGSGRFVTLPTRAVLHRQFQLPVAQGDFNEDGVPDLIAGFFDGVEVLLSDGRGGFSNGVPIYAAGAQPFAVVTGDFNKDGWLDVATANPQTNDVSILLGDGTGGLTPPSRFSAGLQPWALVAADFDNDGRLDLAVADLSGESVSILLGDGSGRLGPPISYSVGPYPRALAVGDFDGDGKPDLAVIWGASHLSIMLGLGHGVLSPPTEVAAGAQPMGLTVGDVNGDGKADLITDDQGGDSFLVLLGNGDGTFQSPLSGLPSVHGTVLTLGDLNGDDKLDLVLTAPTGFLSTLLGDGTGRFGQLHQYFLTQSFAVQIEDVDGDGWPDVVVLDGFNENVTVLRGDGTGSLHPDRIYGSGTNPSSMVVADFNRDGRPDIAIAADYSEGVPLLTNTSFVALPSRLSVGVLGQAYSASWTAAGGVAPYAFSLVGALPAGVFFDPSSQTISGTPTSVGLFPLTVSVTDAEGCITTRRTVLDVRYPVDIQVHVTSRSGLSWEPFTLTAVVNSPFGSPTGTVIFTIDGVEQAPVQIVGGVATLILPSLSAGEHTITARYSGGGSFAGGGSAAVAVQAAGPAVPSVGIVGLVLLALALAAVGVVRLR
jgi:hypothetical protein